MGYQDTIPIPAVAQGAPELIRCQCKAQGKQCSTKACGCHKQHLACTSYCNCSGMTVAIRTLWDKVETEEHGKALMLRRKIMRRMLRLKMLLKKNLLNLRILKMMNLNWKNFDDTEMCNIFVTFTTI